MTRAEYRAECERLGRSPIHDNTLHGCLVNDRACGIAEPATPEDRADRARALAVEAEKAAGTWIAPAKKKSRHGSCYYCGVALRPDGECQECGSQTNVAKYMER